MRAKPLEEQFKRNTNVSLIFCFLVLLWLPTLDLFFHLDHAPAPNENRALAQFPTLAATAKSIHDFPAGLEAYFRDHFGFRNWLIRRESRWKHDLLKEPNTADAITGGAGWLFFAGDSMMEDFQGLKKFSPETLQAWQTLVEKRRDWLAKRGIKYLFVIPPDKHSIYPEFLPAWLAQRKAPNELDQFLAHMKAHSSVEVLDLRAALLEGKKINPTYLQTDTHWNSYGAFIGYQVVIQTLKQQLPEMRDPLPLTAFEQRSVFQKAGDIAKLLGQVGRVVESNSVSLSPRPPLDSPTVTNADERLPKKWKPLTNPVATHYPAATGKAIIFHDSYACAWYRFMGYHFNEVLYIWQYDWDTALIEREKPTVVIDEILERLFEKTETADPFVLLKRDALP